MTIMDHKSWPSYCKPTLLCYITGANTCSSISTVNKLQYHWSCVLCKLYNVSGVNLNLVCAYTAFLPIHLDTLLYNFRFLEPSFQAS